MDYKKIRQECTAFFILLFVTLGILIASVIFMLQGIRDSVDYYTVGGAVFAFFSAYALFVFAKSLRRVYFARKIGDIILYDRLRSVKQIADKINKTPEKVQKAITFLINSDYISGFKVDCDVIINETEEKMRRQKLLEHLDELKTRATEIARDYQSGVKKKKSKHSGRCSGCGAVVVFVENEAICPYCGNLIKSE